MEHLKIDSARGDAPDGPPNDIPPFTPTIHTDDIFRMLIAEELRNGRLNGAQRRRIIRYAAGLGLSAVQIGRLVEECRDDAMLSSDPNERRHALRLVRAEAPLISTHTKIALVVGAAMMIDWLVVRSIW